MKLPTDPRRIRELANRLHIACEDMWEAYWYCLDLKRDSTPPISDSILVAIIVVYARPFINSRSEGRAAPKLDPAELAMFDHRPDLERLHDALLERRHKAVAHSDWTYHRTELTDTERGLRRVKAPVSYAQSLDIQLLPELVSYVREFTCGLAYDLDLAYVALTGE